MKEFEANKLTSFAFGMYAEKAMAEIGPERPQNNPGRDNSETPQDALKFVVRQHQEVKSAREAAESIPGAKKDLPSDTILDSLSSVNHVELEFLIDSEREVDQAGSALLALLQQKTSETPLREWNDVELAIEYKIWSEYSGYLNEHKDEELSPENASRQRIAKEISASVRGALLDRATDKEKVLTGELIDKEKNPPINVDDITTDAVRVAFAAYRSEPIPTSIKQLNRLLSKWLTLQEENKHSLNTDPEGREVVKKMIAGVRRKIAEKISGSEEFTENHTNRGGRPFEKEEAPAYERDDQIPEEKTQRSENEEDEVADDNSDKVKDAKRVIAEAGRRFSTAEARGEARKAEKAADPEGTAKSEQWQKEKQSWKTTTEFRKLLDTNTNWGKYGWTNEHKQEIYASLARAGILTKIVEEQDCTEDQASEIVMRELLLIGKTGDDVVAEMPSHLSKAERGRDPDTWQNFKDYITVSVDKANEDVRLHDVFAPMFYSSASLESVREQMYQRTNPANIEELAWQIANFFPATFGEHGDHPTWERKIRRVDENGNSVDEDGWAIDKETLKKIPAKGRITLETHQVVNQSNILLWQRNRTNYLHEQGPKEVIDFFSRIELPKEMSTINLSRIFASSEKMLASGEAEVNPYTNKRDKFSELEDMMQIEAYIMTVVRQFHIVYEENMGSEKEVAKAMQSLFRANHFTKKAWDKNLYYWISTLAQDFESKNKLDGRVGGAAISNFLSFYHLSNYTKLQELLGADSGLFNLNEIKRARDENYEVNERKYGKAVPSDEFYDLSPKIVNGVHIGWNNPAVDAAFKPDGTVKDTKEGRAAFISIINIFNSQRRSTVINTAVQSLIKETMAKKHGLMVQAKEEEGLDEYGRPKEKIDSDNAAYASLIATHMVRYTGAAGGNDTGYQAFDSFTRLRHLRGLRNKYIEGQKRGGTVGNPLSIQLFQQILVDPLQGISTVVKDKFGRNKNILRIFEEMHATRMAQYEEREVIKQIADDKLRKEKQAALDEEYRVTASQLHFTERAEVDYLNNHFNRATQIYETIMSGQVLNPHDYGHYDQMVGFVIDRPKWQKDIKDGLIKPFRYLLSTYGDLNFAEEVWGRDYTTNEWRLMSKAEEMFGWQILDREEFWMDRINPKTGKKEWVYDSETMRHKIDPQKIQSDKGKVTLYKQAVVAYLAANMSESRKITKFSTAPRQEFYFYDELIEAMEKIEGDIEYDEKDYNYTEITKGFFDHRSMELMRKLSGTESNSLYGGAILKAILLGDTKDRSKSVLAGFGSAVGMFLKASLSGV